MSDRERRTNTGRRDEETRKDWSWSKWRNHGGGGGGRGGRFDEFYFVLCFKKKLRAAGRHACRVKMVSHTHTHTQFSVRRSGQVSIDLFQEVRAAVRLSVSYLWPSLILSTSIADHIALLQSSLSRRTQPTLKVWSTDGTAWVKL